MSSSTTTTSIPSPFPTTIIGAITYPTDTPSSTVTAVLSTINALLSALPSKDATKLLACCMPLGGAASMRGGELTLHTIENLVNAIPLIPGEVAEEFSELEVKVWEDLAMIWAKNEVKVNGEIVSVGVNVISLHQVQGEWKITSVSDTAKAWVGEGVKGIHEVELMRKGKEEGKK